MPHERQVVIVTGANQGIGLGLAHALAELGHRVIGLDLSRENLDGFDSRICDISSQTQVDDVVQQICNEYGRIDVLVNNACLAVFSSFEEKPLEETRREFEVNYFGSIYMIRAVLPQMKSQGCGVIHNFSSTVGTTGFAGIYGYASTKGAIEALTRTLALEMEPFGIAVNLIHPPLTRTRSASPLGVPERFMADPEVVGRRLAPRIGSRRAVITLRFVDLLGVLSSRIFAVTMGRFMSRKAAEARAH